MKAKLIAGVFSFGILLLAALGPACGDEKIQVTAEDGKTARMVAECLTARHINITLDYLELLQSQHTADL